MTPRLCESTETGTLTCILMKRIVLYLRADTMKVGHQVRPTTELGLSDGAAKAPHWACYEL